MISRRQLAIGSATLALGAGLRRRAAARSPQTENPQWQSARKVLRTVPFSEPHVFDPLQSSVNATSEHALMVYDTLFGWDADMKAQPQMVESWSKSGDRLSYSFTLRPGLIFHDGQPVSTRDVIPSLRRMLVRDTQNQVLASLVEKLERVDDRTFTLRLKEPFNYTEVLLGGSNGATGAIMREQDALTDPYTPVKSRIGSGPFRFLEEEYLPGDRLVYAKFKGYKPRLEPASGFAGGKVVKLDRVEWKIMPDPGVAYEALRRGEVDFLDAPSLELLPTVVHNPDIIIGEVWPIETQAVLRFNCLWPPFSHLKARQAVGHAISQRDYMEAAYGDPKYWRECYAFWICGSPNGTEVGSDPYRKPDLDLARRLVKESGYDGAPVVIIGGVDIPGYEQMSLVTADVLKKIGFKVSMQLTDWGTVATRRARKDPPDKGGWNIFHTNANGALRCRVPTLAETDVNRETPGAEAKVAELTANTRPINYLGLPAISLPCGFDRGGIPIGLQIIGRPFAEARILKVADAYQRDTDWHCCRPVLDQKAGV